MFLGLYIMHVYNKPSGRTPTIGSLEGTLEAPVCERDSGRTPNGTRFCSSIWNLIKEPEKKGSLDLQVLWKEPYRRVLYSTGKSSPLVARQRTFQGSVLNL